MLTSDGLREKFEEINREVENLPIDEFNKLAEPEGLDEFQIVERKWRNFLEKSGLVGQLTAESHWGEGGILDLVDSLVDMINTRENVYILDDPSTDGCDFYSFLVFERKK